MKRTLQLISAGILLSACQSGTSYIKDVSDLPVKTSEIPTQSWVLTPLRSHALYVFHDAHSYTKVKECVGDYFFVNWYDAQPELPAKLVMRYTQARTTRTVLERTIEFNEPRPSSGTRKSRFTFNGPERAKDGDVLSWCIELYVDGKLVDSRKSYLWE